MIVLFICFIFFLFTLYILVHDDFIMLRKNVTVEQVFNIVFLVGIISLFSARLVYVAFHFSTAYFNPLVFLLFWYFPGLSFSGGVIGGALFLLFHASKEKLPVSRLFDFFSFALLSVLPIGFIGTGLAGILSYSILLLIFIFFFLPRYKKAAIKEGSLGLYALLFISIIALLIECFQKNTKLFAFFSIESFLLLGMVFVFGAILIKRERIMPSVRRKNK